MTANEEFFLKVSRLFAYWDCAGLFYWNMNLDPYINCNDVFFPGADAEKITPDDLPLLSECLALANVWGPELFVAKKRNAKPWRYGQGLSAIKYLFDEIEVTAVP